MNKRLVVLLGVLAVSVGSAQADWIKHEGHGAIVRSANVTSIHFNQVKHSDLDGFVTACKTKCDENSDTCGGFILNYANTDKTRPAICVFKGEDFTLVDMPTKDFYQVVTHDEVLALLEQLVPNLNTQEDAKWLTEALTGAGYLTWLEDNTGYRYEITAIGPPTDAGSALASTASSRDNANEFPDGSCEGQGKTTPDYNTGCGWIYVNDESYYIKPHAYLIDADLRGAILIHANLAGRSTWLYSADLSGADLSGANLSGVDLRGVDLRGVKADSSTICPNGIKWGTAGNNCGFSFLAA